LRLRSAKGGKAGFCWRLDGQKNFPPEQSVSFDVPPSDEWQEFKTEIPAKGQTIHLRVLLPDGSTDVQQIGLSSIKQKATKQWVFDSAASQ